MKKIMKLLFMLMLLISTVVSGQSRLEKIDQLLDSLYAAKKINGNILIAENGSIIFSKSYGYADEMLKTKLHGNSVFEIASCSKPFTAMAVMLLKEKGKLSLDDEISHFLPELSSYKGVTIRNLLNHTGGLPDYMDLLDSLHDKSRIATNRDIIDLFGRHQPKVLFKPNTKYEYSNTGYAFLASIVEKVSGITYASFLEKNIFKPLGMKHSLVYNRRLLPQKIKNYALGYVYSDSLKAYKLPDELSETKMVVWLDGIVGDGCVNSTVNDLFKWDRALYTDKLLSKAGRILSFEPAVLSSNMKTRYGFGWVIDSNAIYGKLVSHSGSWPGYAAFIDRHVDNDKVIIILQNHDDVTTPIKALRNILYEKPPIKNIQNKND